MKKIFITIPGVIRHLWKNRHPEPYLQILRERDAEVSQAIRSTARDRRQGRGVVRGPDQGGIWKEACAGVPE